MKLHNTLIILLVLALFAGCMPFKPKHLEPESIMPEHYSQTVKQAKAQLPDKWWNAFNSNELNSLVEQALDANLTIEQSWHRLKQAQLLEMKARSSKQPSLNAVGGFEKNRAHTQTNVNSMAFENNQPVFKTKTVDIDTTAESWSLGLAASYEVDLWGKIESQVRSVQLQVMNSREAVNIAATTIAGQVVDAWLQILSYRQQKELLQQQLATNEDILELIQLRFNKSMVTALDVFQQRQTVEQSRAAIPLIESAEQVQLNKLAVLLGQMPDKTPQIDQKNLPVVPDFPDIGLPSDLLTKRPDIRAALLGIQVSQWDLATAKADKLPAFRITASGTYSDDDLEDLFDNWFLNLAANLTVPLLDGNRRELEVQRVKAVIEEKTANYKEVVIGAVRDVENALILEQKMKEHIEQTVIQLDFASKSLNQAKDQYFNGVSTYLPVLTALLKVQNLERDLVGKNTELLSYRIGLYRSLGGSWYDQLEMAKSMDETK